jgi:hypothetical protein
LFDRFGYALMKSRSAGWIIEVLELMACVQISADCRQRFGHSCVSLSMALPGRAASSRLGI